MILIHILGSMYIMKVLMCVFVTAHASSKKLQVTQNLDLPTMIIIP